MNHLSRRKIIARSAALTGGVALRMGTPLVSGSVFAPAAPTFAQAPAEPHFFLKVYFDGGIDSSYLFDARPLSFTSFGKIQNYLGQDPTQWVGNNGGKTLATSLVTPLLPFKQHFSIVNGVHMAIGFEGHDQNANALFTGNPFGGQSYLPHLNEGSGSRTPLDYLEMGGSLQIQIDNSTAAVKLSTDMADQFRGAISAASSLIADDPASVYLKGRMAKIAQGPGRFSEGAKKMLLGTDQSTDLATKIKAARIEFGPEDTIAQKSVKVAHQYFVNGICKSAVILLSDQSLDTHAPNDAAKQPKKYAEVVQSIKTIFDYLKSTAYDEARGLSLLDVTTVVIASEFGRTNFQEGKSMDQTGTDHNTLSNQIILGGKGVRGGQVIGASDLDAMDAHGYYARISGVHQYFDSNLQKKMGKIFDFATMQNVDDYPDVYRAEQYITIASVANTIYQIFGADTSHYWKAERNGPAAKTLNGLLS
jgi:hypothetical protein